MRAGGRPALGMLLLLLLLRGTAAAPAQGKAVSPSYEDFKVYHQGSPRHCQRCPEGLTPKVECPTDPHAHCEKQCQPDEFLDSQFTPPRCTSCVSCSPDRNLVQKKPCTRNSSSVCECQPGLYCQTRIRDTCARCLPLSTCKPGFGVKVRGSSDRDTECEACPPGTFSEEDSSTETCQPRPRTISEEGLEGKGLPTQSNPGGHPPLASPTGSPSIPTSVGSSNIVDRSTGQLANESAPQELLNPPSSGFSKKEDADVTLLATALVVAFLLLAVLVVLWKKRACGEWIVPHEGKEVSSQAEICTIGTLATAEKDPEETDPMHTKSSAGASDGSPLGTEAPASLDPEGAELLQVDGGLLAEPAVRSCTSNCIEKIYIMRADTVIVGSVSEVPAGKTSPARGKEDICGAQEGTEESEMDMHYPEQETEFSPGSDITTPVEEEWAFQPGQREAIGEPGGTYWGSQLSC
ncbi:tumor necrosis factor receptor superfamily member 8 isoform X2 [Paroedura picta]|uniref:tumor necrosis factor receptor superfamily member 8 isoform X2 n=1 Tax=Paroedura picta TaxID=143630 RepID=UPI004057B8CB